MTLHRLMSLLLLATPMVGCGTSAPQADAAVTPGPAAEDPSAPVSSEPSLSTEPGRPGGDPIASSATPAPVATAATPAAPATAPVACTELGCTSHLSLPLVWGKDTLTSSKYTFEITADGKKGKCEVVWPYKSCAEVRAAKCSGELPVRLDTGCKGEAKSTGDMTVGPLHLDATPEKATLKIWREKIMWHQEELTLKYGEVRPNGPSCGPVCRQASRAICIGECGAQDLGAAPRNFP